jgi:hypothetical protein
MLATRAAREYKMVSQAFNESRRRSCVLHTEGEGVLGIAD